MKKNFFFGLWFFSIPALLLVSAAGAANYFNSNGIPISRKEYNQIARVQRSAELQINEKGYSREITGFQDPAMLRKKRIEQWKHWRESKA